MPLQLDHIIIGVHDLDAATQDYRALGFTVVPGGMHASRATHNALITFADETYLELMAPTGEAPVPGVADYSEILAGGEGLVGFALRSDDLDADAARLPAHGWRVDGIVSGERQRSDGVSVQWRMTLLNGWYAPFLIQDVTPRERRISRDPASTTHPNGARGLHGIEIAARDLPGAWARYSRLFGLPQSPMPDEPVVGSVTLRPADSRQGERAERLAAVQIVGPDRTDDNLTLERTHGIVFRWLALPD
ncbi:MAG: VOC family protein [Chloroflexi bacterium]|nr:VOC family protein [Chloroflexota bacterium]